MKNILKFLDIWNWSLLARRAYGAFVFFLSIGLTVMVIILGSQGATAHRTVVNALLGLGVFVVFTFLWSAVAHEKGVVRGFLMVLGYLGAILVLSTISGNMLKRLLRLF